MKLVTVIRWPKLTAVVPVKPVPVWQMIGEAGETSREVRLRVEKAVTRQRRRFRCQPYCWNSRIPAGGIPAYCRLTEECSNSLMEAVKKLTLSSRACHSILKVARTVADLAGSEEICREHVLEAVQHRRFGEEDPFWSYA